MKAIYIYVIILLSLNINVFAQKTLPSDNVIFKHSAVTLMPEGEPENIKTFLPLSPTIVAWGIDPIHYALDVQKLENHFSKYKKIGIENLACNVWMLTATERYMHKNPDLQDAVCKDIEGNKIVPGWLDSEFNGIKPWWGCTNHPLFRELVMERATIGIKSGANLLHLDDHMGTAAAANHSGGCFCRYCVNGFKNWLQVNYSEGKLVQIGIENIETFNYLHFLKNAGFDTTKKYKTAIQKNTLPLRDEFMKFQLYEAAEFVNELSTLVDSVSTKNTPLGVNSWNLDPTQLATSHYADYFSNEVSHFELEDKNPPFVYLLANAMNKPVFSTGTGEDWIHIRQNPQATRINRWIATAYAFGHYFMYSYNKWGFSEETGTQWYQIPIEYYEPYCSFISENRFLFDDYEPFTQIGILYENEISRAGNWEIKEICKNLHYNNIPFGLAASGDDLWMKHKLVSGSVNKFDFLILPSENKLTKEENKIIENYRKSGRTIFKWSENLNLKTQIPELISVKNESGIWTLPRVKSSNNGSGQELVIHLLNHDYNSKTDSMNKKTDFVIELAKQLVDDFNISKVTLFAPEEKPLAIVVSDSLKGKVLKIPNLNIWGILKFE